MAWPWLGLALAALAAATAEAACYGSPITLSSYSSFQYAAVSLASSKVYTTYSNVDDPMGCRLSAAAVAAR